MNAWTASLFWVAGTQRRWAGDYPTASAAQEAVPGVADLIAPEGGGRWTIELRERAEEVDGDLFLMLDD